MASTAEKAEAYAAALREYYAMLKMDIDTKTQLILIQKMHRLRDELLLDVMISHGYTDLIRYIKETKTLLEKRRKAKANEERNENHV